MFLKKNEFEVLLKFGANIEHEGLASWSYNKRIMLEPGKHRIKAKAIGPGHRGNSEMALREGILDSKAKGIFEFELDFEAGYLYRLVAQEIKSPTKDGQSSFSIKVKSKKPQYCSHNQSDLISVYPSENINQANKNVGQNNVKDSTKLISIPAELQYRLDLLTKDLHAFYKSQDTSLNQVSLTKGQRITKKLGIVTDTQNKVKQGILVVAVSPMSLAAQIGILAGDQIIALKINDVDREQEEYETLKQLTAIVTLKRYMDNLMPEGHILFKIRRDNKLKNLTASYDTMSLPAYQLELRLN
jgi:hypothetical protein